MTNAPRILIAEDEDMLLESLVFFLSDEGFIVTEAHHGQEAIDKFKPGLFDIILTDIRMPFKTGDELIRHVVPLEQIPIVVFSGYSDVPNHLLRAIGASNIVAKPVDFEVLFHSIKSKLQPRFSETIKDISNIKLVEGKGVKKTEFLPGLDGFFYACDSSKFKAGDYIQFNFQFDASINLDPISGHGKIYWSNNAMKADELAVPGIMVDILNFQTGKESYLKNLKDLSVTSSIPIMKK